MGIKIYTDGSSRGNPGNGGYGVVMIFGPHRKEISEGFRLTTNNRMELMAVISGLKELKRFDIEVDLYTDSKYVCDSVEKGWIWNWQKTGFKGKQNADLWKEFIPIYKKVKLKIHWIKGHAGHKENERCDELATKAADSKDLKIDYGYEEKDHESKLFE